MNRTMSRTAAASALALLLPACGLLGNSHLVGPDYQTPEAATAARWIDYQDARVQGQESDLGTWWEVFHDPSLTALIVQARGQNLTLRAAAERVESARARLGIAVGSMYPQQQGAAGSAAAEKRSENTADSFPGMDRNVTSFSVGIGAVWELDFWGKFRRGVQAADAELEASIADHDDVLVILYADVARQYVAYRTSQARLKFFRENLAIQERSYRLAQDRFSAGAVSERDVHEARQVLEQTRARIPTIERDVRLANNALCILTGSVARDLSSWFGEADVPVAPAALAVGIPADLLRRRPDVRRTERIAAARSALIGVAEADFYPSISLVGNLGVSAEHVSDLGKSGSLTAYAGPSFTWSLFDYGRTASNVRAFEAEYRAAVLEYQETVLRAGEEVENALVSFLKAQETLGPLEEAVRAARRALEIATDQYNFGAVDFSTVFLFSGTLTEQQDQLARARGDAAIALVELYRALGGGWTGTTADAPTPPPKEK
jgi:NodT family efflux transporter outer membrane factor (OMF) lipoprotein